MRRKAEKVRAGKEEGGKEGGEGKRMPERRRDGKKEGKPRSSCLVRETDQMEHAPDRGTAAAFAGRRYEDDE